MREAGARDLFAKVPEESIQILRAKWRRVSRRLEMTTPTQRSVPPTTNLNDSQMRSTPN